MNFNDLMAKMRELDQPVGEECGMMPPTSMPSPTMPPKQETPPPSMSLNLNAQGMENIEQLMKLVTKVNPDMDKPSLPPMPSLSPEPSIMSIKPSMPPLKMLPDLDKDDDHPEPDADNMGGPSDNDADNADDDKKKEWANDADPETMDMDAAIPAGDDLNKPKGTYPKVAGGDNPMQRMESTDLRSQIRAELMRRLNEAKGVK